MKAVYIMEDAIDIWGQTKNLMLSTDVLTENHF